MLRVRRRLAVGDGARPAPQRREPPAGLVSTPASVSITALARGRKHRTVGDGRAVYIHISHRHLPHLLRSDTRQPPDRRAIVHRVIAYLPATHRICTV